MKIRFYLLPSGLRIPGIFMVITGVLLLIAKYEFNYKPDFLNLKVFAIYTMYIKSQTFTFITHQMIEDLAGILLIAGLFITAFTREKVEHEGLDALRLKAFFVTAYFNLFYLLFAILFFFGFGYVAAMIFFAIGWLIAYLFYFRYLVYNSRSKVIR
jgi:glucose uptake protein GlcU